MKFVCLVLFILSFQLFAARLIVNPIGSSQKGQYVALEEYEIRKDSKQINYKIKIMNTWKNKYVGKEISIQREYNSSENIKEIRAELIAQSEKYFKKYNINI